MEYTALGADQKKALLEQRLLQYEVEHYQHTLNATLLANSNDPSGDVAGAIEQAEQAMTTLDVAHSHVRAELDALETPLASATTPTR